MIKRVISADNVMDTARALQSDYLWREGSNSWARLQMSQNKETKTPSHIMYQC